MCWVLSQQLASEWKEIMIHHVMPELYFHTHTVLDREERRDPEEATKAIQGLAA